MKYFAKIENNVVVNVCVVNDNDAPNENAGVSYLKSVHGNNTKWVQSKQLRKNSVGIGYQYDEQRDSFIPQKPFNSFVFDEQSCRWKAPKQMPSNGLHYWDENTQDWVKFR